MAFNTLGDVSELLFVPQFARVSSYVSGVSAELGRDIMLFKTTRGYVLALGAVAPVGERYLHLAWRTLGYWLKTVEPELDFARRFPMPPDIEALCLLLPAYGEPDERRSRAERH